MNPDDDGAQMSAVEMASEEYIGAMQDVCDALDVWWPYRFTNVPQPVEAFVADRALRDALVAYQAKRIELAAASEATALEGVWDDD
jgi:hypothetical protein